MRFSTEHITKDSRFWDEVNVLAKEAFPPEEYLAPAKLAEMVEADGFDFLALKAEYPQKKQVVDFEILDETAENSRQREKRRNFYLRNGYKETGFFLSYLGVNYEVFCMDDDFDPEVFKAMMKTIRVEGFNPKYFWRPDRE